LVDEESALAKLYDPQWFGSDGTWKKLDGTCLSKNTGEYTYEVCLFGQATQKANNGGASNSLGYVGMMASSTFHSQFLQTILILE
jgi:protein kinase C substrate 80K-H